jgi:DNA-binding beta-propeller fold protein YncE
MTLRNRDIRSVRAKHWREWLLSILFLMSVISDRASAQAIVATVPAGGRAVALNSATNKIYVIGGTSWTQDGWVDIIDGATNSIVSVTAGIRPAAVAVNEVTNKIYIANVGCAGPFGCGNPGSITVLDGATNSTATIIDPNANGPTAVAVNPVTDKIYVGNFWSGNVTEIDGATNSITTITDSNASDLITYAVALNPVTNKVYVLNNNIEGFDSGANASGNITIIDGATNSTTTVTDPNAINPIAVAVNPVTDKIYVANEGDYPAANHGNVTIIDGTTNATTTVTDANALAPLAVAVNQTSNKIYVANENDSALSGVGGVTVIDGSTHAISAARDPNAMFPHALAVDSVTNTIYLANEGCFVDDPCKSPGSVTVINGATNSVTTIIDPQAHNPEAVAVNAVTNMIYVANVGSNNTTIIDATASTTAHTLSVLLTGSGSGTVSSNPAGINCGTSCSASFATGTAVNLNASAASGSLSELSGACTGTNACSVTMNEDNSVTATFSTSPPDFSLQPASASLSVQPGGQVADVITVAPVNGVPFGSAIQLSCVVTGPTPMPTCVLSPSSVTPGVNSAASTLTVTAPTTIATRIPQGPGRIGSFYVLSLPLMFGVTLVGRWKKWRCGPRVLGGLLVLLLFLQIACASGRNNFTTPPPTNYAVTVTATSGAIQHTTQVAVTVQ